VAKTSEITGVKETIKALRRIDPELRKEFNAKYKDAVSPMTNAAKAIYDDQRFPSGTKRTWAPGGRKIFPLTAAKAKTGVKPKINTSYRGGTALYVMQANPAAAVFDIAGRSTGLGAAFSAKFGRDPSRVMWPVAERHEKQVKKNVEELVKETTKTVQKLVD
jgi:hypothetical protein